MREIKFRAWDKTHKRWLKTDWLVLLLETGELLEPQDCDCCLFDSCDYELNQYTGLKDKNGKEIYEGDIIEFNNKNYEVEFNNDTGCYEFITGDTTSKLLYENGFYIKVIGNKWDNPELLNN